MKFKDYYQILGVQADATPAAIKTAYRRLAKKYHPDVSKEKHAEDKFKELNEAYEALKDDQRRAAYDQLKRQGYKPGDEVNSGPGFGGGAHDFSDVGGEQGFSDFFESLFRGGAGRPGAAGGRSRARAPEPMRASLDVDLETVFRGDSQRITLDDGRGNPKQLQVKIPAGIESGKSIRLAGQGPHGADVLLEVRIRPHAQFKLDGRDVQTEQNIMPWDAALGGKITVNTLAGSVEMSIPAGSQSGRKLRLKGRGMPGDPPGDQYVTLLMQTPAADDEPSRDFYRQMQQRFQA
jgi:curved DNA-binding protein